MSNDDFIAASKQMIEVKRIVNLVKGISVNTIIIGESGVGKSKVAHSILSNALCVSAEDSEGVSKGLKNFNEVIIENFDKIRNYDALHIQNQKIVATATKRPKDSVIDKFFGIVIDIEPLCQRESDIPLLVAHFLREACGSLKIDCSIDPASIMPDISQNCHSLKRSVYKSVLNDTLNEETLITSMSEFFANRVEMDDNYAHFLKLFDTAIIQANHKKFRSQLMMSYRMGINRNTLRKKINELGLKLDE